MNQASIIFLILVIGVLGGAELATISNSVSPYTAGKTELWAFFLSFFALLSSIFTIIWYTVKKYLFYKLTKPSLLVAWRQASLIALVIVLSLFFNSLKILSLWDIIPLVISTVLIEFFFQAEKNTHPHGSS